MSTITPSEQTACSPLLSGTFCATQHDVLVPQSSAKVWRMAEACRPGIPPTSASHIIDFPCMTARQVLESSDTAHSQHRTCCFFALSASANKANGTLGPSAFRFWTEIETMVGRRGINTSTTFSDHRHLFFAVFPFRFVGVFTESCRPTQPCCPSSHFCASPRQDVFYHRYRLLMDCPACVLRQLPTVRSWTRPSM